MTKNGLLTSVEALEELGLYNPDGKAKPNHRYIGWLIKRRLLQRVALGPRTFKYKREDCQALLLKSQTQGLSLTAKP